VALRWCYSFGDSRLFGKSTNTATPFSRGRAAARFGDARFPLTPRPTDSRHVETNPNSRSRRCPQVHGRQALSSPCTRTYQSPRHEKRTQPPREHCPRGAGQRDRFGFATPFSRGRAATRFGNARFRYHLAFVTRDGAKRTQTQTLIAYVSNPARATYVRPSLPGYLARPGKRTHPLTRLVAHSSRKRRVGSR
jgi:hypothetical protein